MTLRILIVMDDIAHITPYKDTSFAFALEAQTRGHELLYTTQADLSIVQGQPFANTAPLQVNDDDHTHYYTLGDAQSTSLFSVDVILMRKDPPVDDQFIYTTQMFALAEQQGVLVVNRSDALRNFNEKLFTSYFPDHIPPTIVSSQTADIKAFHGEHKDIICKPLDGMGGVGIFRVKEDANNLGVVIETLTHNQQRLMMAQRYLPEIKDGDKRILIVNGEVVEYCLARLPQGTETRGNLAAGGKGRPQPISASDRAIAETVAPKLMEHGIIFAGLDVIGDKITEINITSPTCVREIEAAYDINICGQLFNAIEAIVSAKKMM